jgi:cytochrome c oxidase cbb3-type subunit 3
MSSRSRIEKTLAALALLLVAGCQKSQTMQQPADIRSTQGSVVTSALVPGLDHPVATVDPRAAPYYDNAKAVIDGKHFYNQYNCSGCHSNGGGGMAPNLMDDQWIYGGRLEQIHQTLVEGRPNGMPSWGGKIPDEQLWEIAAYVRSLSLPETIAAMTGNTPGQNPAPVPRSADEHPGWTPPSDTTNDYTTTTTGPGQGG